jgi:uncharacterized membrane protein
VGGRLGAAIAARLPSVVVVAAAIAASGWAAVLLQQRSAGLATPAYDLAFFQQVVWRLGVDGQWVSSFHQGSFLGLHFSPLLLVPAGIERLVGPDVAVLSVIHAASVGALGPATFLLARAVLRPARLAGVAAAGLAVALPLSAAMQEVVRADFHTETIGVVVALFAGWAGLTGRPGTMWILAAVALLAREDVTYAVMVVGLLVAARGRGRMRRHGLAMAGMAVAWAAVVFLVAMPWLRDGAIVDTHRYYRWLGVGPAAFLAPFTQTEAVIAAINRPTSWFFVAGMVISHAALPLLRPRWLLLAAPPLAAALLSAHPPQASLHLQYPLILVVPLAVAGLLGARRALAVALLARRRVAWAGRRIVMPTAVRRARPVALALALALPTLGVAVAQGSLPPFDHGRDASFGRPASTDRLRAIAAAVPDHAVLALDEGLAGPLANRAALRLLSRVSPTARAFVLIDREAWFPSVPAKARRDALVATATAGARPLIADDGRFLLLGPDGTAGLP